MTNSIDITKPCTTRDGRPVRNLVRYKGARETITGIVVEPNGTEIPEDWYADGRYWKGEVSTHDLIQAPEVVEVTLHYYRKDDGKIWASENYYATCALIAKRTERVTVGEGLEDKT